MDWADEIAASLEEEDSTEGYDGCLYFNRSISKSDCAAAIRAAELRGRVRGMREAQLLASNYAFELEKAWRDGLKASSHLEGMSDAADEVADRLRELATKLESNPTE